MTYHDACPACRLENPVSRDARLAAALLAKKRFDGRAALEERAKWDYPDRDIALATLRQKIGFPGAAQELAEAKEAYAAGLIRSNLPPSEADAVLAMNHQQRVVWCHRHASDENFVAAGLNSFLANQIAPEEMAARSLLRSNRKYASKSHEDELAARKTGHALDARTRTVFMKALDEAGFREATHSHENKITLSERGHEGVETRVGQVSASSVGLGRAYQKRSAWVASSTHVWFVSPAILTPEVKALNAEAPKGILYLRHDLRAKQGAGTSITMQTKTARGAWK